MTTKGKTTKTVSKETRPRKWRKPVPCPTCGSRNIRFDPFARAVNRKHPPYDSSGHASANTTAILIITSHTDLKEATRAWNKEATRQGRKHSK